MADEALRQAEQKQIKKVQSKKQKIKPEAALIKKEDKKEEHKAEEKPAEKQGKGLIERAKEKISEAKETIKKKDVKDNKIIIEREYIVPLRKEWRKVPEYKRANKAVKALKQFMVQHMKVYDRDLRKIKMDVYLNNELRFRGIKKPPAFIKVKAIKYEDGIVVVKLVDFPKHIEFELARKARKAAEGIKKSTEKKEETKEKPAEEEKTEQEIKEIKEKEDSSKEAMQELEKAQAKQEKHSFGGKQKAPIIQRKALQK